MITKGTIAGLTGSVLFSGLVWTCLWQPLHPGVLTAQQQSEPKKPKSTVLTWSPPEVDRRLKSLIPEPPCVLPSALQRASERANTTFDDLKSFIAHEDIQFQAMVFRPYSDQNLPLRDFARSYDYIVFFKQTPEGFIAQDSRKPLGGSSMQPAFDQDLGLTELALIFLPAMQGDYEFKCEGTVKWSGEPTWVIRFQQHKDKPRRTISFRGESRPYPASLRGRAWIAAESGEILHMETSLVDAIPEINIREWYLSINYAPVVFPEKNVRLSLPQMADVYVEFEGDRRTVTRHMFSNFRLFSATVTMKP
jgi:hypothetical protein